MKWKKIKEIIDEQISDESEVKRIRIDEWSNPEENIVCELTTEGYDIVTWK